MKRAIFILLAFISVNVLANQELDKFFEDFELSYDVFTSKCYIGQEETENMPIDRIYFNKSEKGWEIVLIVQSLGLQILPQASYNEYSIRNEVLTIKGRGMERVLGKDEQGLYFINKFSEIEQNKVCIYLAK